MTTVGEEKTSAAAWLPGEFENWPRSVNFGNTSPLFFAENKDRYLRQLLIRDIQLETQRPLVVYFASPFLQSSIRNEDIKRLYEVLYPFRGMSIDIMIETRGGETDAAEGLVSVLRSTTESYRAIIPVRAKSNGTLVSLGADSIIMGPTSELGPVEPSFNFRPVSILMDERYAEVDLELHLQGRFAYEQTKALTKKLLRDGVMKNESDDRRTEALKSLCTRDRYASHGSVIDHQEAMNIGLAVEHLNGESELWQKLYLLHCMYSHDSAVRNVSKFFEQERVSNAVHGDED